MKLVLACLSLAVAITAFAAAQEATKKTKQGSKPPAAAGEAVADKDLSRLESDAKKCKTAKEAAALYQAFLGARKLTESQKKKVEADAAGWNDRATKGIVRIGTKWVSPDEAKAISKSADELIKKGLELTKLSNFEAAKKLFEKASNVDQNDIRADFILGLLNSGLGEVAWHPQSAEKHFTVCLRRNPSHISVLNNLGLAEVKTKQYSNALDHWATALKLAPNTPAVTQNLGRLIQQASLKKIQIPDSAKKRAEKLYANAVTAGRGEPADADLGWLLMRLYLTGDERERATVAAPAEEINSGSATGFVIHPGFVLTNRHVAEAGDVLRIVDPADSKIEHSAKVVAVSDDEDLDAALLQCESLKAPAVAVSDTLPRRSTEVLILGYPLSDVLGNSLKATRGVVSGFMGDNQDVLLYDAVVNPGNSGGPVADKTGAVVGIVAFTIGAAGDGDNTRRYGGGPLLARLDKFLSAHVSDFAPSKPLPTSDWPEIDAELSKSTVFIKIFSTSVETAIGGAGKSRGALIEDRTCSACQGMGHTFCTARGCVKGTTSVKQNVATTAGTEGGEITVNKVRVVKVPCETCQGTAKVDCEHCEGGLDDSLDSVAAEAAAAEEASEKTEPEPKKKTETKGKAKSQGKS